MSNMCDDKKNRVEIFQINPATGMIDVLGNSGYNFNLAIADLIDNSISAHAKNIMLYFDLSDEKEKYFYLLDDGKGMTLDELKNSAIIGLKDIEYVREDDDLGRYSTGLKAATRSFCDDIVISSKKENEDVNSIEIDYSHIHTSKNWEAFLINNFFLNYKIQHQGTLIFCNKLNFQTLSLLNTNFLKKLEELEEYLGHIFGKFLLNGDINISIKLKDTNDIEIKGWNPFSLIEDKSTKLIYSYEHLYKNSNISFKTYILPTFNNLSKIDQEYMTGKGLIEQEGFYIYRNRRLIIEGGWLDLTNINLDDKSKYARIEVNIPSSLDKEFRINYSKNSLEIPDDLKALFSEIAKKARKESKLNYNYLKYPELRKSTKKENELIWKSTKVNGAIVLSINKDHPLISELTSKLTDLELKKLCNILSKSLPISMIQGQNTIAKSYSENELIDYMDEIYKKYINDGIDKKDIRKIMSKIEPFKDNLSILIDFFDEKEKANDK